MSNDSSSGRGGGVSRRDFIRGRFWRARQRRLAAVDGKKKRPFRVPLVMRYPKTLAEVERAGGELDEGPVTQERKLAVDVKPIDSPIASPEARRRVIPVLRPPGAIEESRFLAECTRCDKCRQACPHDAIVHAPPQMREAAGTPMIEADHQACQMCPDFPCITACEPNVLTSSVPPVMGTAIITQHLCLAHHGTTCTVCSERCPVENAIEVEAGKPTVRESSCTGCGVCRYVCPAPENAVLLMPAFVRPSPRNDRSLEKSGE